MTLVGTNSLAGLVFNNYGGTAAATVTTGGTLTLTGGANAIRVTSQNPAYTPIINGTLDIGSGANTFNVGAISVGGQTLTQFTPALTIAATIVDSGSINKSVPDCCSFPATTPFPAA